MRLLVLAYLFALAAPSLAETPLDRYYAAEYEARTAGKTLLVYVGRMPFGSIPETVSVKCRTYDDVTGPAVIVARPSGRGTLEWVATLSNPTAEQVREAVKGAPGTDALDEVNRLRAASGLRPFIFDEGLTRAAKACADYRAANLIEGHCGGQMGDFAFLPPGVMGTAAGCAAWDPASGWGSCCSHDSYTYAGAAWTMGRDGRRYMHLWVR